MTLSNKIICLTEKMPSYFSFTRNIWKCFWKYELYKTLNTVLYWKRNKWSIHQLGYVNKIHKVQIHIFYTRMGWKIPMMMSCLLLMTFWSMGSKHWNTNGKSKLKNESHLVTFHENTLVNLWTFQLTFIYHVKGTLSGHYSN